MVLSMERWKGTVAVVTGASSGIGYAIAQQLVEAGLKVAGLARREARVEELAQSLSDHEGKLYAIKCDITQESDILNAFAWVKENLGPIHILVNNAGIIRNTTLVDGNTDDWRKIFDTNVIGLCIATREAVRDMRANNVDGHIIHINSITGHTVPNLPLMNVYPGSKHAVTALTETLRQELNFIGSKIKISSVSPGAVDTEIAIATGMGDFAEVFGQLIKVTSEDLADAIIYVLSTPPNVQVHELTIKPVGEAY